VLRKVDLSSLPKPWDRVDLSPDNELTYTGLLNVQLVWGLVTLGLGEGARKARPVFTTYGEACRGVLDEVLSQRVLNQKRSEGST
jgi:hypothetical protein